jgi:hypothetical protein
MTTTRETLLAEFASVYSRTGWRVAASLDGMTVDQLQTTLDGLYEAISEERDEMDAWFARQNEDAEMSAREWEQLQAKADAEAAAEAEWSKWQHHYDRLVGV